MIRFELYRWTRSRRLLLLVLVLVFSGVTSPLTAAYLPEILGALGGGASGVQVTVPEPTWQDLVSAYFKNSSQLALLFSCYLAAWGCSLGSDDRLRIYYLSRSRRAADAQGARLLLTTCTVAVAVVAGGAVALYSTLALTDGADLHRAVLALLVQAAGLLTFSVAAACLACAGVHTGLATAVVLGTTIVGSALDSIAGFRAWSPTVLLSPSDLLSGESPTAYTRPLAVMVGLLAVTAGLALRRSVRRITPAVAPLPDSAADGRVPGSSPPRPRRNPTHDQEDVMVRSGPTSSRSPR
jgi:ABC-2 type transport system permease protein